MIIEPPKKPLRDPSMDEFLKKPRVEDDHLENLGYEPVDTPEGGNTNGKDEKED